MSRTRGPQGRIAATLALVGVVLLWGLRDFEHRRAVSALAARTYQGADPLRVSAYPAMTGSIPLVRRGGDSSFLCARSGGFSETGSRSRRPTRIRYKPEETPITLAAKRSYLGRVYLDWAQYPITETEALNPPEGGYIVDFQDLALCAVTQPAEPPR